MNQEDDMILTLTLSEVLEKCINWEKFCDEQGWDYYAVNEGGGDIRFGYNISENS